MTAVVNNSTAPPEVSALLDFVGSGAGSSWMIYMGPHINQRNLLFKRVYVTETFDREIAIQEILRSYVPMLIRENIKYNKGEGRRISKNIFTDAIKQETAEMILAWLLREIVQIRSQQNKVNEWRTYSIG